MTLFSVPLNILMWFIEVLERTIFTTTLSFFRKSMLKIEFVAYYTMFSFIITLSIIHIVVRRVMSNEHSTPIGTQCIANSIQHIQKVLSLSVWEFARGYHSFAQTKTWHLILFWSEQMMNLIPCLNCVNIKCCITRYGVIVTNLRFSIKQ